MAMNFIFYGCYIIFQCKNCDPATIRLTQYIRPRWRIMELGDCQCPQCNFCNGRICEKCGKDTCIRANKCYKYELIPYQCG